MAYAERAALYKEIETYRQRPLVAYMASGRPGVPGQITIDGARKIAEQLRRLPAGNED
jgi:hypothetical protein